MIRVHYKTSSNQAIDNVVIRFSSDPSVTTEESYHWDARSLNCCTFIASLKGNENLAIQTRPVSFIKDTVRLRVASTNPGNFKLQFTEFQYFAVAKDIILLDSYTGTQQEVNANPSYDFTINADATSQGADRFKLVFVSEQLIIQCPPNIVSNHSFGTNGGNVLYSIPVTLAKCGQPYINFSHLPGSFFPIGNTTVNIDAYDLCGNTSNCSFVVTVKDVEPPIMSSPISLNYSTDEGLPTYSFIAVAPLATDNHKMKSVDGFRSDNKAMDQPYPIGTTRITWKASDSSGNITSVVQFVTVKDNEAPVIAAANIVLNTGLYNCTSAINNPIQVTDNSGYVNFTGIRSDGADVADDYPAGTTIITWTASDAYGNTSTDTQQIIVNDNVPPVITPATNNSLVANFSGCKGKINNTGFDPQVYDNCAVMSFTNNFNGSSSLNGIELPQGITNIIWTAIDGSGNSTSWLQAIEVTVPVISLNIPDAMAMTSNVDANTIYLGYTPASVLAYNALVVGATNYQWSVSSNLEISGASNNAIVNITATNVNSVTGTLSLSVTNNIGCAVTATKLIEVMNVSCGRNKVLLCSPASKEVCISDKSLKNYFLAGYKLGACDVSQAKPAIVSTALLESSFKVYPNPNKGMFQLQLNNYHNSKVEVRITDVLGKLVAFKTVNSSNSVETISFDLQKNAAGVYNVQVISSDGITSTKVIVGR